MVEPSFLAETCTPSSFCPVAEVIEPVSNWSADAVLAAPTRTTLATLANNWHRKFVMMFLSSGLLDAHPPRYLPPLARGVTRDPPHMRGRSGRGERWLGTVNVGTVQHTPSAVTGRYPSAQIVWVATRFSKQHGRSGVICEARPRRTTSLLNN